MKQLLFILLLPFFSSSQSNEADRLLLALPLQKEDTNKVNILNELAWELNLSDAKQAHNYAKQAEELSRKINFRKGIITSLYRQAQIQTDLGHYNSAEKTYSNLMALEKNEGNISGIAKTNFFLGVICCKRKDYPASLKHYKAAFNKFKELKDKDNQAKVLNSASTVYQITGELDLALALLHESMAIRKEQNKPKKLAFCHSNLAALYLKLDDYDSALEYALLAKRQYQSDNNKRSLRIVYNNLGRIYAATEQYDKALTNYTKVVVLAEELGIENDSKIYTNIGSLYYKKENQRKAEENYLKALKIQEESGEGVLSYSVYQNLGMIYFDKNKYRNAITFFKKALDGSIQSEETNVQKNVTKLLSLSYAKIDEYENANKYSMQHIELNEKFDTNYKRAVQLDAKYKEQQRREESLIKDKEIALTNLKKRTAENNLQRVAIYSLLIGSILLLMILFAFYRSRQHRLKASISEKSMRLEQQKIQEVMKDMELQSMNSMLEGQEEERQRIAADLHDRLGSMLSMVKLHFASIDDHIEHIKSINKSQFEMASELLDNACAEVRKIAHNMISGVLDKFGLVAALEDLSESLNQSEKLSVEFIHFGMDSRLNRKLEISIYRVVQELISNTLKHAKATDITIQLLQSKDNLNLIVEDDGVGFDVEAKKQGMGLKNLASRVNHINGELTIDSSSKTGTTITIDIPNPIINPND